MGMVDSIVNNMNFYFKYINKHQKIENKYKIYSSEKFSKIIDFCKNAGYCSFHQEKDIFNDYTCSELEDSVFYLFKNKKIDIPETVKSLYTIFLRDYKDNNEMSEDLEEALFHKAAIHLIYEVNKIDHFNDNLNHSKKNKSYGNFRIV